MRISDQQVFATLLGHLQRARTESLAAQEQVTSGKRVAAPSDDPAAFSRIVGGKAAIARLDHRLRTITAGADRLRASGDALNEATNLLTRVKELAVALRNDANGPAERAAAAAEARQLTLELRDLANRTVAGRPLFGGTGAHGRATGLALSPPVTLASGSTDTLRVTVDGTASGTITLAAGTYTGAQLAALVEAGINADATLAAAGKAVAVTYETDHLVIASKTDGSASTVTVTGGTARASLGFNGGGATTGANPYALSASAVAASDNAGGADISQASVTDPARATLADYLIRFSSATTYTLYNVSAPVAVSPGPDNTGAAAKQDAGVADPTALTLDDYEITFTSDTQYTITNTTTGTVLSSGNAYTSGSAIEFDGLRVTLRDGEGGGPKSGDTFTVALRPVAVLADRTYTSGSAIEFDGLSLTITTGSTGPAAGDRFAVTTGVQYQGDSGRRGVEVADGRTVATNLPGDEVFSGGTLDIFAALKSLTAALMGNDGGGLDRGIADADRALDQIVRGQAEAGALAARLDRTKDGLDTARAHLESILAGDEDADLVRAASALSLHQFAVEATSQALARILDSSLLRFLR